MISLFLGDSVWYFCREFHDEQQKVKKKEGRRMLASVTLIVMYRWIVSFLSLYFVCDGLKNKVSIQ